MAERRYTTEDGTEVIEWYHTPLEAFVEEFLGGLCFAVIGLLGALMSPLAAYWAWRDNGDVYGRSELRTPFRRRRSPEVEAAIAEAAKPLSRSE